MDIAKAIVLEVYSMDPPGRFLKQCPDTGQWKQLSRRDAADRAAQAIAYAIRGKDEWKRKRNERRHSLRSSKKSKDDDNDDVGRKLPQSADRPTRLQQVTTAQNSESNLPSSVARDGFAARRGESAVTSNDAQPDASDLLRVPGNSILQQQQQLLLPQLNQQNIVSSLPASVNNPINNQTLNQHGLIQQVLQTLQQQQPQLPLQNTSVPNPWGQVLQSQIALQPAVSEGLKSQLLNQAQQQQYQQLLLQSLLNQQNVLPSASLPTSAALSAPLLTGPQSQSATINLLLTLQQQLNPASSAHLLSSLLSNLPHQPTLNAGISNAPPLYGVQQMDQLQRSLMLLQQNDQLLASSLGASSNVQLPFQLQPPLGPLLQQTLQASLPLQPQQQLQLQGGSPPRINSSTSANNVAAQATRQEESEDEEESEPGDDSDTS
eukprot:scaffold12054_cov78-Skeletonema_menzelii.AAC.4